MFIKGTSTVIYFASEKLCVKFDSTLCFGTNLLCIELGTAWNTETTSLLTKVNLSQQ